MLEVLCGNKNVQKILLFLFVNGKCYGSQLQKQLKTPLTPLQKALSRLERGGIVSSYYVGRTRLYQFNPGYPLMSELELLLKKAYALLPQQKKRELSFVEVERLDRKEGAHILFAIWEKLAATTRLIFTAKSKEDSGWNGKGKGEVSAIHEGDSVLLFNERGSWVGKEGREIGFTNTFRWTLDRKSGLISLEHLRQGINNPVFLFQLAPSGKHGLCSVDSHLCGKDIYFGQITYDHTGLRLHWRIIGPKKNEEINYFYS